MKGRATYKRKVLKDDKGRRVVALIAQYDGPEFSSTGEASSEDLSVWVLPPETEP